MAQSTSTILSRQFFFCILNSAIYTPLQIRDVNTRSRTPRIFASSGLDSRTLIASFRLHFHLNFFILYTYIYIYKTCVGTIRWMKGLKSVGHLQGERRKFRCYATSSPSEEKVSFPVFQETFLSKRRRLGGGKGWDKTRRTSLQWDNRNFFPVTVYLIAANRSP